MSMNAGTFIEGVGDEVIYGALGLCIVMALFAAALSHWLRGRGSQHIHPQSEDAVEFVRRSRHQDDTNEERPPPTAPPANSYNPERNCPICITAAVFAVETNCGHLFCGSCLIAYWEHGNWLGAVRCPVCRQQVNLLLKSFSPEENLFESAQKAEVVAGVNRYNRRFSGQPIAWLDYLRDLPTILRHCCRHFFSVNGLLLMFRLRVLVCFIAALLYFISPLDIIPEAVFGILGFFDDFFILLLLAVYISIIYRRVVTHEATT